MAKKYAGLVGLSYADTVGGGYTAVTGPFGDDSTIELPNTQTQTTDGSVYGGSSITGNIRVLDDATYATLAGFMTADTAKFWRFTFEDGTVLTTVKAFNIFVERQMTPDARTGVRGYLVTFEDYTYRPLI